MGSRATAPLPSAPAKGMAMPVAARESVQLGILTSTGNLWRATVRLSAAVLFSLPLPGVPENAGREATCL